jgi:hypothetical protein
MRSPRPGRRASSRGQRDGRRRLRGIDDVQAHPGDLRPGQQERYEALGRAIDNLKAVTITVPGFDAEQGTFNTHHRLLAGPIGGGRFQ